MDEEVLVTKEMELRKARKGAGYILMKPQRAPIVDLKKATG